MTILDEIVEHKKEEIKKSKENKPISQLLAALPTQPARHSFRDILDEKSGFHLICEIKKASPSRGIIQTDFNPKFQAQSYDNGGASAISVVTDSKYFQGDLYDLFLVRSVVDLPVLRKDFIIDPYQILESKLAGADMILLIARILTRSQISEFSGLARELKLDVLVEISSEQELEKIEDFEHIILGINNRDLTTFRVDLNRSVSLRQRIAVNVPTISESGIRTIDDCLLLAGCGFQGALVGETLMRKENPEEIIKKWVKKISDGYKA